MSKITGNEPAYPLYFTDTDFMQQIANQYQEKYSQPFEIGGLSKREFFAAIAMQGYCANEAVARMGITLNEKAKSAVMQADELINELNKQ